MVSSEAPLLLSAALVGILHMSAPDHWVTLCIMGRIAKWSRPRLLGVSLVTAAGHVMLSVVLGSAFLGVGLIASPSALRTLTDATGVIMILVGGWYGVKTLAANPPEEDYEREAEETLRKESSTLRGAGYLAVLGAALSPDLSILPVFVLSVPLGLNAALATALSFGVSSIAALCVLVMAGSYGLGRVFEKVAPKYNDAMVGFVIAAVGAYVLVSG